MSADDTIPPDTDDEIRARLRAFAQEVTARVDTQAALRQMPRPSRAPYLGLLAIAACLLAVVAVAALAPDPPSVDTTGLADSPTQTTDCPDATQPRAITEGAQMKNRLAGPAASATTAILLLGGCGDDGPTTLAQGNDVELVDEDGLAPGDDGLGGQTLNINAEEEDGEVTGELRFTDSGGEVVVAVECADTDTDGVVILGGTVKGPTDSEISGLVALFIEEGDPDRVAVWLDRGENGSCDELLENRRDVLDDDSAFVDVETGSDIDTG